MLLKLFRLVHSVTVKVVRQRDDGVYCVLIVVTRAAVV